MTERVLVWQWGRRGAMPRFAAELVHGLQSLPGVTPLLSLAEGAEILHGKQPPPCILIVATYRGVWSCALRLVCAPVVVVQRLRDLRRLAPDVAICVHAGPLDPLMALALRLCGVKFFVIIHDATTHPGDRRGVLMVQRVVQYLASGCIVLSAPVAEVVRAQRPARPVVLAWHPPLPFGPMPAPPRAHGGRLRLLFFGRLLPYKGLDLLASAAELLGQRAEIVLRVIGEGAESPALARLRALPWAVVENRWVPESEIASLLAWADAIVLPYTEASQSGVAAAAIAAGRFVIATRVGGLSDQLAGEGLARLCAPNAESLATAMLEITAAPSPCVHAAAGTWAEMSQLVMQGVRHVLATC